MQQIFLQRVACAFLAVFFAFTSNMHAASLLRYVFGSEPVSQRLQKIAEFSDTMTNFDTAVFKMNGLSKKLGLSSFNWFNTTWIYEEAIQHKSDPALLWQLLHEKYHTIAYHDVRRIIGELAVDAPLIAGVCTACVGYVTGEDLPKLIAFVAISQALLARFLFLWHEEYCESQANAYADHMMREPIMAGKNEQV